MMSAENKHIGKKKKELVLILVILAVSALLYAGTRIIFSKPPMRVEISVDGTVIETLDLNKDTELTVEGWNGGTNHVVIKDGTVHVTEPAVRIRSVSTRGRSGGPGKPSSAFPTA